MSRPAAAVPARVGVIGGGRMGAGIAQVFLAAGGRVTVVEAGAEAAEATRRRIAEGLEEARRRGKLNEDPESAPGRLAMRGSAAELDPRTDLVVEAVPEQPQLKAEVLQAAETAVGPGAVLATNTREEVSARDCPAQLCRRPLVRAGQRIPGLRRGHRRADRRGLLRRRGLRSRAGLRPVGRRPCTAAADLPRARSPGQVAGPDAARAPRGALPALLPDRCDAGGLQVRHRRRHRRATRLREQGQA